MTGTVRDRIARVLHASDVDGVDIPFESVSGTYGLMVDALLAEFPWLADEPTRSLSERTKTMSSDRLVTVYENADGEEAYQPTLLGGECLYTDYTLRWNGIPPNRVWVSAVPRDRAGGFTPVLYRSERRAHRKAAKEQARRDKRHRQAFRKVQDDEQ